MIAKIGLYIPIPGFRDTTDVVRKNIQFAEDSLKRYQNLVEKDPENPPPTLFTKLFKGEEDDQLTMKELRDEAMIYILAGSDTTALTLTYLVWAVCRDAAIRKRLVDELAGLPRGFDDADLRRLPYLNQVIDEALRLYASAPAGLPRVVPPGGATLAGYALPGGTVVSTQAYSMHRIEAIFPDPERFDPSRWEVATKDMRDASMPWGGGSRSKSLYLTPTATPREMYLTFCVSERVADLSSHSMPRHPPGQAGAEVRRRAVLHRVPGRGGVQPGRHVRRGYGAQNLLYDGA